MTDLTISAPFQGTILAPNATIRITQKQDGTIIGTNVILDAATNRWDPNEIFISDNGTDTTDTSDSTDTSTTSDSSDSSTSSDSTDTSSTTSDTRHASVSFSKTSSDNRTNFNLTNKTSNDNGNKSKRALPKTGSQSNNWITLAGVILLVIGLRITFMSYKKSKR